MTNLDWPEELAELAGLAREVGLEVLGPAARDAEADGVPAQVWATLFGTGLTTPVDEALGGGGVLSAVEEAVAAENLAYGDPGITLAAFRSGAAALLLTAHGTPEQKETLRGVGAAWRGSVALHEGYGRSPQEYETTVTVDGDQVRVQGRKESVAFAHRTDTVVVIGNDPARGGLRAVLVPTAAAGVEVVPDSPGLALGAVPTSTVTLDVTLPAAALLGGPGADPEALARSVERIRLLPAAVLVGCAQRAVEYAAEYAKDRVAFGRPIVGFQGVSFLLAEAVMRLAAARHSVLDVASHLDAGHGEAASRLMGEAISYTAAAATQATRDAVQVLGGHGFIRDHPVELWYRSAAAISVTDVDPLVSVFDPAL
jgi:alkylation response protein AidB-like acyl-CoA dehydrogenase